MWNYVKGGNLSFATTPNLKDGSAKQRVVIDSNGNVGIGSSTPQTTLDVNGPIAPAAVTPFGDCAPVGAIGHDSNGNLLSCVYTPATDINAASQDWEAPNQHNAVSGGSLMGACSLIVSGTGTYTATAELCRTDAGNVATAYPSIFVPSNYTLVRGSNSCPWWNYACSRASFSLVSGTPASCACPPGFMMMSVASKVFVAPTAGLPAVPPDSNGRGGRAASPSTCGTVETVYSCMALPASIPTSIP